MAALFWLFQASSGNVTAGDPLDRWHLRNPLPVATALFGVAHGNGLFLAVGDQYGLVTSPDGMVWTRQAFPATNALGAFYSVAFGHGRFAAVDGGTNVWTTPDGISWTGRGVDFGPGPLSWGPMRITFASGRFVAVGGGGLVVTSPDADQWTARRVGQAVDLSDVTYGQGSFVAVGSSYLPGDSLFTSPDGSNWTAQDSGADSFLGSVAYGNGQFVAAGGQTKVGARTAPLWVLSSPDGTTWTHQELPGLSTCSQWRYLSFLNGQFFAGGNFISPDCSTNIANLLTSPDGINWRANMVEDRNNELIGLAYAEGHYVAVGRTWRQSLSYLFSTAIFSSSDGTEWTRRDSGIHEVLGDVTYGNGQFVAVGSIYTTNGTILTSTDGAQWTRRDAGTTNQLQKIAWGNGRFVVVGGNRRHNPPMPFLLTSTNGANWASADPGTTNLLTAVAYGNGVFTVIGGNDTVITSADGTTWNSSNGSTNGFKSCRAIAAGNGIFVAVGDHSWNGSSNVDRIFTSADGLQWTQRTSGVDISLRTVAFGNGRFVALPVAGSQVLTSPDGIQWTLHAVAFDTGENSSTRYALAFGNGRFVAAGQNGSYQHTLLYSSADGVTWETHDSTVSQWVFGVAFGAGVSVAVADFGVILQSDPLGVPGNAPRLGLPRWLGAGGAEFTLTGDLGVSLRIESSSDLAHWDPVTNLTLQTSPSSWRDASAVNSSHKFYRAVTP